MIYECLSRIQGVCATVAKIPDTYGRKIVRLCVFQHAENAGLFERCIIKIYKFFTQCICSTGYEPARAKKGWQVLEQLGAKSGDIRIENHSINVMEWDPKDLEEKINRLGGRWDRTTLSDGQKVFAIHPPRDPSDKWKAMEPNLLKFWPKREGLIITCTAADQVSDAETLMIQVNSASTSYIMMRKKMAFYIGCKRKLVCFDPPGTALSSGVASEGAYYTSIRAVFDRFAHAYPPERVWVGGACLGCASIAYLRSQIPHINLILENGFVDLQEDMVKRNGCFVYWVAKRFWQALLGGSSRESGFNIERTWQSAARSSTGKIIVVSVENDQRLPQSVAKNLVAQARRINEKVFHAHYHSSAKDPHFSRFEDQPQMRRQILQCIFE